SAGSNETLTGEFDFAIPALEVAETVNSPAISGCPSPQKTEQKNTNFPSLSATNSITSVEPFFTFLSMPYSLMPTPWSTSTEVTTRRTVSPLLTVILFGSKVNFLAVILTSTGGPEGCVGAGGESAGFGSSSPKAILEQRGRTVINKKPVKKA